MNYCLFNVSGFVLVFIIYLFLFYHSIATRFLSHHWENRVEQVATCFLCDVIWFIILYNKLFKVGVISSCSVILSVSICFLTRFFSIYVESNMNLIYFISCNLFDGVLLVCISWFTSSCRIFNYTDLKADRHITRRNILSVILIFM